MKEKRIIRFYRTSEYGNMRERFVDKHAERVYKRLTGKTTLDSISRELVRDLSGGKVDFELVGKDISYE